MNDASPTIHCPSCGAPLAAVGTCAHCGSQARGFWDDLDLGTPELADAVVAGLDYYQVLGAPPDADLAALTDAYVVRRRRFPDDAGRLHPQLARQLGLLEEAWRILGVPARRAVYDRLCAAQEAGVRGLDALIKAINCVQCGSPFSGAETVCGACGSPRRIEAAAAPEQPLVGPVDYYAVLGVAPLSPRAAVHGSGAVREWRAPGLLGLLLGDGEDAMEGGRVLWQPTSPEEIELAYLGRQRELLLAADASAAQSVEVAYRVLGDAARRATYDGLMASLRERGVTLERLRALDALDREVRAELAGAVVDDAADLLEQGRGYLKLDLPAQAVPLLQRAAAALPDSAEAQYSYGMALWRSADIAALTPHQLRQLGSAFGAVMRLDPRATSVVEPYAALCAALLLYNQGALPEARAHFEAAARQFPRFAPAWRMCAAAALQADDPAAAAACCERAIALDPSCEPVMLLAIGAAVRQRQSAVAWEWAGRVARLRGSPASPAGLLRELGLA